MSADLVASLAATRTVVVDDVIAPASLESMQSVGIRVVTAPAPAEAGEDPVELYTEEVP